MDKTDLKVTLKALYSAPVGSLAISDAPPLDYLMIDGAGDPNLEPAYKAAVEALYIAAYTLKFMSKAELDRDFVVPPLEGLWRAADWRDFAARRKARWAWTMMIAIPEFIDRSLAERAIATAVAKKPLPALAELRVERLEEGRAVQTLHLGAYDDEGPILKRLHEDFLPSHGLVETGDHHEIYLSDPRRATPEKLKTILRQPVRAAHAAPSS